VTIVTATHDLKMLKRSDRIVWIEDGLIGKVVTADELDIDVGQIH
jgi:putative ABC transport system ATP-binding protein